jgi:hypothetical protein
LVQLFFSAQYNQVILLTIAIIYLKNFARDTSQHGDPAAGPDISQGPTKLAVEDNLKAVPNWPSVCQQFFLKLSICYLWLYYG